MVKVYIYQTIRIFYELLNASLMDGNERTDSGAPFLSYLL